MIALWENGCIPLSVQSMAQVQFLTMAEYFRVFYPDCFINILSIVDTKELEPHASSLVLQQLIVSHPTAPRFWVVLLLNSSILDYFPTFVAGASD